MALTRNCGAYVAQPARRAPMGGSRKISMPGLGTRDITTADIFGSRQKNGSSVSARLGFNSS